MNTIEKTADVLIVGGGTAGCYAALTLAKEAPELSVLVVEKANIVRSGCLAAGVNALNAYITKGHTPDFYVDYAVRDAHGIAREDLLLSMSEHLNEVTARLEELGLVILKDENGEYVARGNRNLKINGENIKPLLAEAVYKLPNVEVLNYVNVTDLLTVQTTSVDSLEEAQPLPVVGAVGHSVKEETVYVFHAPAVLIATGGASGIYKPNHPGFSRHKMWYSPFNTGAGYAMGLLAGAELTTLEMRFIALRCKDTIAPTGTLAQGVGAKQVNSLGDVYEDKYGLTTSQRVWGTVAENEAGRGPCYLRTVGIGEEAAESLEKAYLNMAPSQTLKWVANGTNANETNVEIEGTEPYIIGGHTSSGFWVDDGRRTTVPGLYAAGDVAGGCPQKYVTGALAEGLLAAQSIAWDFQHNLLSLPVKEQAAERPFLGTPVSGAPASGAGTSATFETSIETLLGRLDANKGAEALFPEALEESMQTVMDEYAGGISQNYAFTEESLKTAEQNIRGLLNIIENSLRPQKAPAPSAAGATISPPPLKIVRCATMRDVTHFFEMRDRLVVSLALIAHLNARKETRWHCFAENHSFPKQNDEEFLCYINSKRERSYSEGDKPASLSELTLKTFPRPLSARRPAEGDLADYRDFTGRWQA